MDHQVKLRGFRIELGEIEAALLLHPAIRETVVVIREDVPGDRRLVAYMVPKSGMVPEHPRAFLRSRLPGYMVPSAMVMLEALPLSSNGKVDRKALPRPDAAAMSTGHVAPRTAMEESVAEIWADVLKIPQVGVKDHFFELGGHSLLAMQMISRLKRVFGLEVPLRALFDSPVLESFCEELQTQPAVTVAPIVKVPRDKPLPLSFFQERIWQSCQSGQNSASYFVPLFVDLYGVLDVGALHRALNEIVRRHEILRTTYAEQDGQPVQVIREYQPLEMPMVDLSEQRDAYARAKIVEQEEALGRPDLAQGPLIRTRLLKLDEKVHRLLLTIHHIVYDESGIQTFFQELDLLYSAYSHGEPSPLEELPIQYGDFCVWQRRWFRPNEGVFQKQLAFWAKYLAGKLHAVNLPFKREKPLEPDLVNGIRHLRTNREFTEQMRDFAQQEGVTPFLIFLTAYKAMLSQCTGQENFVVGTYASTRSRPELDGQMGFLSNLLALRADLAGDPTFRELIQRARKDTLDAFEHRDLPFDFLSRGLQEAGQEAPSVSALFTYTPLSDLFKKSSLVGLKVTCRVNKKKRKYWGLSMSVIERAKHVRFTLSFDTDQYEPGAVHQMLTHYRNFMQKAFQQPNLRLSQLASPSSAPL